MGGLNHVSNEEPQNFWGSPAHYKGAEMWLEPYLVRVWFCCTLALRNILKY